LKISTLAQTSHPEPLMRRVNWTFAACLVFAFAVAAGAVHALHVVRYGTIADELRVQVDRCRDEGRPDDAIHFASQYLDFRPGDVAMMADLAGWLNDKAKTPKQRKSVLGLYEHILRLTPDDRAARLKAAEMSMKMAEWAAALDHLDVLLRGAPDDAELCEDFGYCQQAVGKYEEAATWYQKAIRGDPHRVTAYIRWAGLLQQQLKHPEQALPVIDRAVQANPESGPAHAARAQFLRAQGRLQDAAEAVHTSLKFTPDDATALLVAADIEQSLGNYAAARKYLDIGSKKYSSNSQFVCGLAWQLLYEGHADRAIALLRDAKTANPKDVDILTLLGDLLAQDGQVGPLEETLRDLTELNASSDRIQYVQARLLIRRGRWAEAASMLDRLRVVALRTPALYRQSNLLLAQCYEQLGDAAGELDAYRRLLDHDPNAATVRLDYARALARAGRQDEALSEFLSVVARPEASPRAVVETTRALIERAAAVPKALAEMEKAVDAFKLDNANPNPILVRAYLDLFRFRAADSLIALDTLVRAKPRIVPIHVARAAVAEQVFGLDRALAALTDAEAAVGDQPDLRLARVRFLAARLDPAFAETLAAQARGVERFGAEDRSRILLEVVAAFRCLGDSAAVGLHLDLLAQARPDSLPVREARFARALRAGDAAKCQAVLREVEAIEGADGPTARLLDAEKLLWLAPSGDAASLAKAEEQLVAAGRGRPNDPIVEFLRGRVDELAARPTDALNHYRVAFDRGLADRPVEDLFGNLTGKAGTAPVAILLNQLPLMARLRTDRNRSLIIAVLPLYSSGLDPLVSRLTAAASPTDATQQIWLGRLFARLKLDGAAEAAFRRASVAAPQSPEGWLALVAFQAGRPNVGESTAAVNEVREKMPPIEAHLVVGRALESVRQPDAATKEYEAAAALNPADTRPLRLLANLALTRRRGDEARQRLEQITALPTPSSRGDQAWARRTLAVQLTLAAPSADALRRALTLVDQNKVNGQLTDDDQRARVLILAAQRGQPISESKLTARQEAIRTLEELQKRGTARSAEDLMQLVRLYRAEGDDASARQARQQLRTEYPNHLGCVAFLAREALRDHDLPACEELLPTLRRLGPGQFDAVAIEFQFRALAGGSDLGRKVLDDYIAAAPSPEVQAERAVRSADLIFDFLQTHPADDRSAAAVGDLRSLAMRLYRPAADRNPQAFQRLVTLLAAQPDGTNQALALVERSKRAFKAEIAAAAYVLVLRYGHPGAAQQQAMKRYLEEERDKAPQYMPLMLTWAEYLQLTGENAGAVTVYREVLRREPDNVLALNNLAWTLSLDRKDPDKVRESLALIQHAIDLAGPLDELLDTRARILFESGQSEAGLRDMCEAVNEAPSAARLKDYAIMLRKAGKTKEAERALAQAGRFGIGVSR
jgi:tetratricopeptide (TPR) repeat protein